MKDLRCSLETSGEATLKYSSGNFSSNNFIVSSKKVVIGLFVATEIERRRDFKLLSHELPRKVSN